MPLGEDGPTLETFDPRNDTRETLPILYRDEHYVAIHKPAGLLVHRSSIDRRETRFAVQLLREQIDRIVYPAHRLDRPTSGLLVFGLTPSDCATLSHLFQQRQVSKEYLAVTRGHLPPSGVVDSPLHRYSDRDGLVKGAETQDARTQYQRLAVSELPYPTERYATSRFSLVRLQPTTGRRHQLRRHLAHIRYPIIGDTRHGCNKTNRSVREHFGIERLMLAATAIRFEHPFTGRTIHIDSPLEESFRAALRTLQLQASS